MAATGTVNPAKVAKVEALVEQLRDAPVVGIVDVQGIPARQFQSMRRRLRDRVHIRVAKNTLLRLALERVAAEREGLDALAAALGGQAALVTTALNPFRLFKELEGTKTNAPAKGGEVSPTDIWIRAGETPFKPGPIVGDLQKAGLPAAIERGKVLIKKDKLVVTAGERIPREVAQVLTRLEIYPLVVGLDLRSAYEAGQVYGPDVLAVDDVKLRADVTEATRRAVAVAIVVAYPTAFTIPLLVRKAHRDGLGLAVHVGFPTGESLKLLLAKAHAQALALAGRAPEALDAGTRRGPSPGGDEAAPEASDEDGKEEVSEEGAAAGPGSRSG